LTPFKELLGLQAAQLYSSVSNFPLRFISVDPSFIFTGVLPKRDLLVFLEFEIK